MSNVCMVLRKQDNVSQFLLQKYTFNFLFLFDISLMKYNILTFRDYGMHYELSWMKNIVSIVNHL